MYSPMYFHCAKLYIGVIVHGSQCYMMASWIVSFALATSAIALLFLSFRYSYHPFHQLVLAIRNCSLISEIDPIAPMEIPVEEYMKGYLYQNDSRIIDFILKNGYLKPPKLGNVSYNLKRPSKDPSVGQSTVVKKVFQEKRNGFFVECGALDGETRSNTLSLERDLGWKGLLVEGDPKNYKLLISKNRKAWTAGCCLAIHPYPHQVTYFQKFNRGMIKSDDRKIVDKASDQVSPVRVQCFPVSSLLSAMNITTVDYFSLDVEGFELDVLKTIPFDSIHIKVLTVEFSHVKGGDKELVSFMSTKGYKLITKIVRKSNFANDVIFAHKTFPVTEKFPSII